MTYNRNYKAIAVFIASVVAVVLVIHFAQPTSDVTHTQPTPTQPPVPAGFVQVLQENLTLSSMNNFSSSASINITKNLTALKARLQSSVPGDFGLTVESTKGVISHVPIGSPSEYLQTTYYSTTQLELTPGVYTFIAESSGPSNLTVELTVYVEYG